MLVIVLERKRDSILVITCFPKSALMKLPVDARHFFSIGGYISLRKGNVYGKKMSLGSTQLWIKIIIQFISG